MKKVFITFITLLLCISLSACSGKKESEGQEAASYKIGICNYVDDASLNQIVDNISRRLDELNECTGICEVGGGYDEHG